MQRARTAGPTLTGTLETCVLGGRVSPYLRAGGVCRRTRSEITCSLPTWAFGPGRLRPLPSPRPNSQNYQPSSARLPASEGLAPNQPFCKLEGRKQAGVGPGWLVCNALQGLVAMSPTPHRTLFKERQSAHLSPSRVRAGLCGVRLCIYTGLCLTRQGRWHCGWCGCCGED